MPEGRSGGLRPGAGQFGTVVEVAAAEDFSYPLAEGESAQVRVEQDDLVEAPVQAGQAAGRLVYLVGDQEIGTVELCYVQSVNRDIFPESTLLQRILSAIFGKTVTVSGQGVGLI